MNSYRIACLLAISSALCATEFSTGLEFDDALLVPQYLAGSHQLPCLTTTRLTKKLSLNIPLMSADMPSITDTAMAIAIAQQGGIGIIPIMNSIEEQSFAVRKVKRHCTGMMGEPLCIGFEASTLDAANLMAQHGATSVLVVTPERQLVGIITKRDVEACANQAVSVLDTMTSRQHLIVAKQGISFADAAYLMKTYKIKRLPLINEKGVVVGLLTAQDLAFFSKYPHASLDHANKLLVGASIGMGPDALEHASCLVQAGADVLVLSSPFADTEEVLTLIRAIKNELPTIDLIVGNIATAAAAQHCIDAGADALKIGVGNGTLAITHTLTGVGYPQLSALLECTHVAECYNIPIIADGGIKKSGDIMKAIAAGASCVMLGYTLAGAEEAPGKTIIQDGKKYKTFRSSSSSQQLFEEKPSNYFIDGIDTLVSYAGTIDEIIPHYVNNIKEGIRLCGAHHLEEARGKRNFILKK